MSFESAMAKEFEDSAEIDVFAGDRVYNVDRPPGDALPALVIEMDGGRGHERHMAAINTLTHRRGTLNCYHTTPEGAEAFATVVRKVIDGFSGTLGSAGHTANIKTITLLAPIDDYVAPTNAAERGTPFRRIPFEAWLIEAVA